MLTVASLVAQLMFAVVVLCFVLYVLLELRVLRISNKVERRRLTDLESTHAPRPADYPWPRVSVLLPIYNEATMLPRLIDGVCRLQYPTQQLEILVLDDSTDGTSDLARTLVGEYAAQGHPIRYLKRPQRKGYKAGNLRYGMSQSQGQFFAIFDADFVPPADFLLKTIPCFDDPQLGYLQTGIAYENRDVSFLTRFQAMEMGHQQVVTVGLNENGNMASLSGSSCVWRRDCVEALGGWNASTITEDVDLGYRAQLDNWKYAYLRDVVSLSVLPETTMAFRVQRERWGRGLMHSAFKHVGQMFRRRMPVLHRLHGMAMMFSSLLLASIYVLFLLCLPLAGLLQTQGTGIVWLALLFFGFVAVWGLANVYAARKGARFGQQVGVLATLWHTYVYVALFLPMAWYYFVGGLRALAGVHDDFNRTPKGNAEQGAKTPRIHHILLGGDVFSLVYAIAIIGVAIASGNIVLIPVGLTAVLGFGLMLGRWVAEWRAARRHVNTSYKQ